MPSEIVRKLNPHILFGSVGIVVVQNTQRDQRREVKDSKLESVQTRLGFRVTLVAFTKRKLDGHDNIRTAMKPLVDRITEWLGYASDDDPGLAWEYGQQITAGSRGVAVKIESMHHDR